MGKNSFEVEENEISYTPIGLLNLGNTCYINSVLQCLGGTQALVSFFADKNNFEHAFSKCLTPHFQKDIDFGYNFAEFIQYIWKDNKVKFKGVKAVAVTRSLIKNIPGFDYQMQQDAQETLIYILNHLSANLQIPKPSYFFEDPDLEAQFRSARVQIHPAFKTIESIKRDQLEAEKKRKKVDERYLIEADKRFAEFLYNSELGVISDIFQIILVQIITCKSCSYTSRTLQQSFDLSLSLQPVERNKDSGGTENTWVSKVSHYFIKEVVSLQQCLDHFFKSEQLCEEAQYFCENCECKQDAVKSILLANLPEVLILHLNRFAHVDGTHFTVPSSNTNKMRSLMTAFISPNGRKSQKNGVGVDFPTAELDLNRYLFSEHLERKSRYELYALIKHSGNLHGGHYISCVKDLDQNSRWFEFDDDCVKGFYEESLANYFSDAYILFYRKVPKTVYTEIPLEISEKFIWVPLSWVLKLRSVAPGVLNNFEICCPHGQIRPEFEVDINLRVIKLDFPLYERFCLEFGRVGEPLQDIRICNTCKDFVMFLNARRESEREILKELEENWKQLQEESVEEPLEEFSTEEPEENMVNTDTRKWYMIDCTWIFSWRRFVMNDERNGRGSWHGVLPLKTLENSNLEKDLKEHRRRLKRGRDYIPVSDKIWNLLSRIYPPTAIIFRSKPDIYYDDEEEHEDFTVS